MQGQPLGSARQHLLAVLVLATDGELNKGAQVAVLDFGGGAEALDGVTAEYRAMEVEGHVLGEVVEVAAELGWDGGGEEAMHEQAARVVA